MKFRENSSFLFGPFFVNRAFARVSPVFVMAAATLFLAPNSLLASGKNAEPTRATIKRDAAEAQFTRAEEQRAALNQKSSEKRTLAEYKSVVASYKKVYLISPHAADVQDSLLAVAELQTEMGDRFGRTYYQQAVESYQFLLREYPKSKFSQDIYLRSPKLQQDKLGDTTAAMKTYQEFLKRFPHSSQKREAQEALAELSLLQDSNAPDTKSAANVKPAAPEKQEPVRVAQTETKKSASKDTEEDEQQATRSGGIPTVKNISATSSGDSTRITIALEDAVQYISGRIANPDRIYFDLHAARLSPRLKRDGVKVNGNLVLAVRVAQNPSGVVRIVLDVNGVKDYTASLLSKPS